MDQTKPKQGGFLGLFRRRRALPASPPGPHSPPEAPAQVFVSLFGAGSVAAPATTAAAPTPLSLDGPPPAETLTAAPPSAAPQVPPPDPVAFLTPSDLARIPLAPVRLLAIGSCFLDELLQSPEARAAGLSADFVLVNEVAHFPDQPPSDIGGYDCQIIQIPLRAVMRDTTFSYLDDGSEAPYSGAFDTCCNALRRQLKQRLRWNTEHGTLTFVMNFMVPQFNPMGRLQRRYDFRNPQYFVDRLNQELERIVRNRANAYLLDIDTIAASFGRRHVQDDAVAGFNHGNIPQPFHTLPERLDRLGPLSAYYDLAPTGAFRAAVVAELRAMLTTIRQEDGVKLVVLDLDDTLWQGVSGDTDDISPLMIEGWPHGLIEALHYLRKRGVLLAIISKNDDARIREIWHDIFANRLHLEDFAAIRINWRPKPENMREVLQAVNLLPANVLFVDDNPAERAQMQAAYPDMRIIGGNPFLTRRILLLSAQAQVATVTAESRDRTAMIQAQAQRDHERDTMPAEDFLEQQDIRIRLATVKNETHAKFPRALELINKTNQFNTTGQRWTHEECKALFTEGGWFAVYDVEDRYTPYGLVGVMLIKGSTILQWVMSCRVLGMGVEQAALCAVAGVLRSKPGTVITARLIDTQANQPCRGVYADAGFIAGPDGALLPADLVLRPPASVRVETSLEA